MTKKQRWTTYDGSGSGVPSTHTGNKQHGIFGLWLWPSLDLAVAGICGMN